MGLHPDVKKFLRTRFPSSVGDGVPETQCDVLVCDHMWLLFKFHPDEGSTGEDLVDFFWRPMLRFFRAGGTSYVCVFDVPERVPVAKAEEHKKRYGSGPRPEKPTGTCSTSSLPLPWHAALADREARADVCAHIARGVVARFERHADELKDKSLVVSGVGGEVVRADANGSNPWTEHASVADVGEGDLAVAYWVNHFSDRSVVARVLDTDQIPILMLRAKLSRRDAPLHVWLVSPRATQTTQTTQARTKCVPGSVDVDETSDPRLHGYECIPPEGHTLVDVLRLNDEMERTTRASVEEWVFWIIAQKTDFVDKIVQNLGVGPTLAALEEDAGRASPSSSSAASSARALFGIPETETNRRRRPIVRVTASRATCDSREMSRRFVSAVASAKRKRATIREDADVEFRRAWWTLLYWSYGWDGPLRESLRPRLAFGFDERGMRAKTREEETFPDYVPDR